MEKRSLQEHIQKVITDISSILEVTAEEVNTRKISNPHWLEIPYGDARGSFFEATNKLGILTVANLVYLSKDLIHSNYWKQFINFPDTDEAFFTQDLLDNYNFLVLTTWLSMFTTLVEETLKAIINELKIKSSDHLKDLIEAIDTELGLKYSDLFNILRLLKNGIHSNYVPTYTPPPIIYKGKNYEFKKGEELPFLEWESVLLISKDICEAIREIVNHPRVLSIDRIPRLALSLKSEES